MSTRELMAQAITDDRLFFDAFIRIEDRDGQEIMFKLNPAQELLYNGLTGRDIVVKGRQLGITTFLLARGLKKVLTQDNTTAVVVAYEEFLTQKLLQRVQNMYDRLPWPDVKKPVMSHKSAYEKYFPRRKSVFYIGTAGAKVFGRGEPIHYFIGSEFAFWTDPWRILNPVMQSVPLGGEIIIESTPNGMGSEGEPNAFYSLVTEGLQEQATSWHVHELNWWLEGAYRIPEGSKYALPMDKGPLEYTDYEEGLIRRIGWRDQEAAERIRWRRLKVSQLHGEFEQEYLEDLSSCFLSVGEPVYDFDRLAELRAQCFPSPYSLMNARVWYQPEEQASYVISIDPGQGKNTRSVALVWRLDLENYQKIRHEATLAGYYDPITFAPMVAKLGEYYHWAKLIPEANGHGMAFCAEVKNYPNLYYRTGIVSGISTKEIGWLTTGATRVGASGTKMYMITELQSLLGIIDTQDVNLINELAQVRYAGNQVKFMGADDYHDAAAIMAACRHNSTGRRARGFLGRAGWKW